MTLEIRGRIIEDGEFRHARCIYSHVRYTVRTMSKIIHPKRLPNPTLHTTLPEIPCIQLLCLVRRRSIIGGWDSPPLRRTIAPKLTIYGNLRRR